MCRKKTHQSPEKRKQQTGDIRNERKAPNNDGIITHVFVTRTRFIPIEMGRPIIVQVSSFKEALKQASILLQLPTQKVQTKIHPCKKTKCSKGNAWALI
jgi:hypothetical protein